MLIGKSNLDGKSIFISPEDRLNHIHILGTTGAGKSKLLEYMIGQDIDAHRGVCLVDPHGDLFKAILAYVTKKRIKDVIIINPDDSNWSVGLNFLEHDTNVRSSTTHASEVMKGIAKVFGGENTDVLPRLQRWERNSLIPLIERHLTLVELASFADPTKPYYRKVVLEEIQRKGIARDVAAHWAAATRQYNDDGASLLVAHRGELRVLPREPGY